MLCGRSLCSVDDGWMDGWMDERWVDVEVMEALGILFV